MSAHDKLSEPLKSMLLCAMDMRMHPPPPPTALISRSDANEAYEQFLAVLFSSLKA